MKNLLVLVAMGLSLFLINCSPGSGGAPQGPLKSNSVDAQGNCTDKLLDDYSTLKQVQAGGDISTLSGRQSYGGMSKAKGSGAASVDRLARYNKACDDFFKIHPAD